MHYANARQVKVGDPVVGTVYNTKGIVAGLLVGVTPGTNTCNCRVLIPIAQAADPNEGGLSYSHVESIDGKAHASLYRVKVDYGQCDQLLHAEDAFNCGVPRAQI